MKNNKKRGFTLVELLVVIAILAILATVSVVGYTSFIERAAVSNDENLAAQLNNFMIAIKADHTSEFYNQEVTPENARDFVYEALVLGNLEGKLKPDAADHGYHFYYDLKEDKIVVLKDAIDDGALLRNVLAGLGVAAVNYDILDNPATCFTKQDAEFTKYNGIRYVFLDTEGSELAELINLFYNVNSAKDFARLQELATKALFDGKKVATLETLVNKSIFVGTSGSYVTSATNEKTLIFGTTMSGNKYQGTEKMEAFATPSTVINVPNNIKFFTTNSLNFATSTYDANAATHTTVLHFNMTLDELAKKVDPNFTNVVFTLSDNKQYACANGQIICLEEGGATATVEPKNPVLSFDFKADETNATNKVYNYLSDEQSNVVYIAWDKGTFKLEATKFVGKNDAEFDSISAYNIEWDVHPDSSSYVEVTNKTTGEFRFVGSAPDVVNDECIVKIIAKDTFGTAEQTFEIKIVRVKGATFAYDGKEFASTNTLLFGEGSKDSYTITATTSRTYSAITEITLDNTVSITPVVIEGQDNVFAPEGNLLKLNGEADGTQSIKITVDGYTSEPISITVYNAASLTAVKNNANIVLVGDDNPITVGDLLKINADKTMPANAEVWVLKELGDSNFGNMNAYFESEYVADGKIPVNTADWTTTQIKFTGNGGKAIVTIVAPDGEGNYIRIADNHEVTIVDGKNVRKIADLEDGVNNVLLTNLVADETYAGFTLTGKTLYGNQHYIDLRGYNDAGVPFEKDGKTSFEFVDLKKTVPYAKTLEALITLKGATLDNVKIVGEVYKSTDFIYQNPNDFGYGASLVKAEGGSTIVGCYLANTRSPLITTGAVTVEDTTIFGGNYANVDVRDGSTLVLKGNVTTVNQIITGVTDNTVGFGIAVDLFADYETTSIVIDNDGDDKCILKQYNYVSQADASKMPIVTYGAYGQDVNIFLSKKLNNIFNDTTGTYDSIIYKDKDGKEYINATIAFENGLLVKMNGSDVTEEQAGTKTGNGQQISGCDYEMKTAVSHREKSVDLGCSTMTVTMDATIFFWTPTADVNTNSGEHFDNTVPEYCLPGYYVPGN